MASKMIAPKVATKIDQMLNPLTPAPPKRFTTNPPTTAPTLQPHTLPCPLLRHREFDFYVAPGGFGVRAELVRVVHQRLRLLVREAGKVPDQFDLEAEAVPVPADADIGRDGGVFA